MLTIITLGFMLTAVLGVTVWARTRVDAAPLGRMGERWLTEHKASNSASPNGW